MPFPDSISSRFGQAKVSRPWFAPLTSGSNPRNGSSSMVTANPPSVPFQAMAGIWGEGSGRVILPGEDVAFVPERPYLHAGPLRDTLVHTKLDGAVSDSQALDVLRELGLESLAQSPDGLREVVNWDKQLPLATQQLLVIARVLLSEAKIVVIDHPLSTLTDEDLQMVWAKLRARRVTCFCFGSGEENPAHFDRILRVATDGTWELTSSTSGPPGQPSRMVTA